MIRTLYTDPNGLLDVLKRYVRVSTEEEQKLIRAAGASLFNDLGITIVDTHQERDEVLAKIPKPLLIRAIKLADGGWMFLHAHVKGLGEDR